jgi:hypothetical protein
MPEPTHVSYAPPPPLGAPPNAPPDGWADARLSKLEHMMRELEQKLGRERDGKK